MATYDDVTTSISATLTGTTQDLVNFVGVPGQIEVVNHHASEDLWFVMGVGDPGAIPGDGDGAILVTAGDRAVVRGGVLGLTVRLLGNGNRYTVNSLAKDGYGMSSPHGSLAGRSDPAAHPAASITVAAIAGLTATEVQAALAELLARIAAAEQDITDLQGP